MTPVSPWPGRTSPPVRACRAASSARPRRCGNRRLCAGVERRGDLLGIERRRTSTPLGRGQARDNAVPDWRALILGKRAEDREQQFTVRRGRVHLLGKGPERDARAFRSVTPVTRCGSERSSRSSFQIISVSPAFRYSTYAFSLGRSSRAPDALSAWRCRSSTPASASCCRSINWRSSGEDSCPAHGKPRQESFRTAQRSDMVCRAGNARSRPSRV